MVVGGVVGIIGFFVIPVVGGLFLGFIVGTYFAELARLRRYDIAWSSTLHAVKAVGLSMLVELFGALIAAGAVAGSRCVHLSAAVPGAGVVAHDRGQVVADSVGDHVQVVDLERSTCPCTG